MLKAIANPSTRYGDQTISDGDLIISTPGKGVNFSADGNAPGATSETLSDYEEGTWTPTMSTSSSSPTFTYTNRGGNYTKIGRLVRAWCYLNISVTAAGTGEALILTNSLPFVPASNSLTNSAFTRGGVGGRHPSGTDAFVMEFNNDNPANATAILWAAQGPSDATRGNATTGLQTGKYSCYLEYEAD